MSFLKGKKKKKKKWQFFFFFFSILRAGQNFNKREIIQVEFLRLKKKKIKTSGYKVKNK